ncbi:hypothetical protein AMECASPLE_038531 [Ameca splendens]|uniref:Uncharacterized protein n=1 Tax=Ameca splendens TaxID=208324 RepID=A0ABV0Z641_9TELE
MPADTQEIFLPNWFQYLTGASAHVASVLCVSTRMSSGSWPVKLVTWHHSATGPEEMLGHCPFCEVDKLLLCLPACIVALMSPAEVINSLLKLMLTATPV